MNPPTRSRGAPSIARARPALLAALLTAVLLGGCGMFKKQAAMDRPVPPLRIDLNDGADPAFSAEETNGIDADALALQAQQDVNEFLRRRNQGPSPEPAWNDGSTPAVPRQGDVAAAPSARGPGRILWRDRFPRGSSPAEPANDGFQPGPLFRDAPLDPPAVRDLPDLENAAPGTAAAHLGAARVNELIVQLSSELFREAAYDDVPLRQLLLIAALTMADPERALEPSAISGLTDGERELLATFQLFFSGLGRKLDGSREVEEVLAEAVAELRQSLSKEPPLALPRATLCTRVGGFGDFDELKRNKETGSFVFLAHAESRAIVYLEVDEFTSEQNEAGDWVTELSQQLVIYADRDGIPVWKKDWEPVIDRTRNRRTDFFTVQIITLPKALSVGRYHLKVRVRDEQSGAETETGLPIEMVADPKMIPVR